MTIQGWETFCLNEKKRGNEGAYIYGAGEYGSTWGYDLLKASGFAVKGFLDSNKPAGSTILISDPIEGKKEYLIADLSKLKKDAFIAVCVGRKYREEIAEFLKRAGFCHIIYMDYPFYYDLVTDLDSSDNQQAKEKYRYIYDDELYIKRQYEYKMGYLPDLVYPGTFDEKLQWMKLFDRNPLYTKLVDKYEVKTYVADQVGDQYIVPTLGVWECFEDIDFDRLPDQFVLKCTHDSGSTIVVRDKSRFDRKAAKEKLQRCLKHNYFWPEREWQYKNVQPRIIAEEYIDSGEGGIVDYKIHCFHGNPVFIQVIGERDIESHKAKEIFKDLNWQDLNWSFEDYPEFNAEQKRPQCLEKMIDISKILSRPFPYVRVDLYSCGRQIKFGELTFTPNNGIYPYKRSWTRELDSQLGKLLQL